MTGIRLIEKFLRFTKRYVPTLRMSETAVVTINDSHLTSVKRSADNDTEFDDSKRLCVERIRKRKVAMMLSYCGHGYFGMQRNPGTKTIEEDLLNALIKIGAINEDGFLTPQNISFQRAARTDKGVSAACQVVSLKLPEDVKVESINEHLPDQIRAMAIKRVTKGFNSKGSCDSRTYSYTVPTFAFSTSAEDNTYLFRISPEILQRVTEIFKLYEGTHNFHNFTSRKKPLDPSAQRFIIKCSVSEPFISKGLELVVLQVKGQSFMLHQIRKMVGLLIAITKGFAKEDLIHKAYQTERLDIPMAPGLGLVLEEVHYDRYNQKFGDDGIHEPLNWNELKEAVETFKKDFIQSIIINTEIEEKPMIAWLETLPMHSFDVRRVHIHQEGSEDLSTGTEEVEHKIESEIKDCISKDSSCNKVAETKEDGVV